MDRVFFSDRARPRARVNKITFSQENFNMNDATVPLSGEVFWMERLVARHWERVEVYIQAFSSFSLRIMWIVSIHKTLSFCNS